MARPFLADADWVRKRGHRSDEINTCIGCNQACLDHTFQHKIASCLVNPRAGHETLLSLAPTRRSKRIAVVGAGPAGLAAATTAAERGHVGGAVEADAEIGGQFQLARRIPGKEEFAETLRYFTRRLELTGVKVHVNHRVTATELAEGRWDEVVLATGVTPRAVASRAPSGSTCTPTPPSSPARPNRPTGRGRGCGGIGFDVSEFLTHVARTASRRTATAAGRVGRRRSGDRRGGLRAPVRPESPRRVYLLQRRATKVGAGLGKTSAGCTAARCRRAGRDDPRRGLRTDRRRGPAHHGRRAPAAPALLEVDDV